MSDDAELAFLRAVSCSVVLERMAGWKLDARQSTPSWQGFPGEDRVLG